nr:DNA repair protein RecO [Lachnospiraceae bacterium]
AEVNLLYFSFLELEKGVVKSNLIRLIFEYRMLQIQGIGPNVYECVVCTEEKNGMLFDIRRGGLVCPDCIAKNPMLKEDKPFRILGDTVYTLKYILSADIKKLFSFNVSEEVLMDLKRISGDYFRMHVGHTFKSLQFLTED